MAEGDDDECVGVCVADGEEVGVCGGVGGFEEGDGGVVGCGVRCEGVGGELEAATGGAVGLGDDEGDVVMRGDGVE